VLSIGKLAPGQEEYHTQMVALGVEDYYVGAGEAPGQWMGRSVHRLGLDGEVDADDLRAVLVRLHPSERFRLTGGHSMLKVGGFDCTFCSPKSMSLLFALGDGEMSNEVRNAHDTALNSAFGVLEHEAARARRDGEAFAGSTPMGSWLPPSGIVCHAPPTPSCTPTSWWPTSCIQRRTGAGRHSMPERSTPGQAPSATSTRPQLRWELTRRLGVDWEAVHNGMADIKGSPRHVLRAFSTRREEIERNLAERGESGARAAQRATDRTRRRKDRNLDIEGLAPAWRHRAARLGFDKPAIGAVSSRVDHAEVVCPDSEHAEALFAALASPGGLTRRASTFGRREVIRALCDALPHGAPVGAILELSDAFLASEHVVCLTGRAAAVL
jgi:hypothetical protein